MKRPLLAAVMSAVCAPAFAYEPPAAVKAAVEAISGPNAFSGVALIDIGDGRPWIYATGQAVQTSATPVTPQTRFDMGSITKVMTTVAVIQLVERGKISLDATIGAYLPDFPAPARDKVTITMLLGHVGGLDEVIFSPAFRSQAEAARNSHDLYALVANQPHINTVNGTWSYSNSGFIVLGEIIARVSGQTFEAYLKHNVLDPAGMSGVAFSSHRLAQAATGYGNGQMHAAPTPGPMPPSPTPYDRPMGSLDRMTGSAAGGLYARAVDMAAFGRAMLENRLIKAESLALMCSAKQPAPARLPPGMAFGWGCMVSSAGGVTTLGHTGGRPGMQAEFVFAPAKGAVAMVMSNHDGRALPVMRELRPVLAALPDR